MCEAPPHPRIRAALRQIEKRRVEALFARARKKGWRTDFATGLSPADIDRLEAELDADDEKRPRGGGRGRPPHPRRGEGLAALRAGEHPIEVAARFGVSRNTVAGWARCFGVPYVHRARNRGCQILAETTREILSLILHMDACGLYEFNDSELAWMWGVSRQRINQVRETIPRKDRT